MSDWLLLTVEPCRLAREMEVCRDMDAVSFIVVDDGGGKGKVVEPVKQGSGLFIEVAGD